MMKSLRSIPPFVYILGFIALFGAVPLGNRLLQGISHALNLEKQSLAGSRSLGAIAFSPANASASLLEGNVLFKQGEYKQAAQQFQRAISEMPENLIPRIYAQNAQLIDQDHLKIAVSAVLWQAQSTDSRV